MLEKVHQLRCRPVSPEDESWWACQVDLGDIRQYKDQLNEYLEACTKGPARHIVDACGKVNALDAWRRFAERGHSLRPTHVHGLMKKSLWPQDGVAAKDLEVAVAQWETDIQRWDAASSESVSLAH